MAAPFGGLFKFMFTTRLQRYKFFFSDQFQFVPTQLEDKYQSLFNQIREFFKYKTISIMQKRL